MGGTAAPAVMSWGGSSNNHVTASSVYRISDLGRRTSLQSCGIKPQASLPCLFRHTATHHTLLFPHLTWAKQLLWAFFILFFFLQQQQHAHFSWGKSKESMLCAHHAHQQVFLVTLQARFLLWNVICVITATRKWDKLQFHHHLCFLAFQAYPNWLPYIFCVIFTLCNTP